MNKIGERSRTRKTPSLPAGDGGGGGGGSGKGWGQH